MLYLQNIFLLNFSYIYIIPQISKNFKFFLLTNCKQFVNAAHNRSSCQILTRPPPPYRSCYTDMGSVAPGYSSQLLMLQLPRSQLTARLSLGRARSVPGTPRSAASYVAYTRNGVEKLLINYLNKKVEKFTNLTPGQLLATNARARKKRPLTSLFVFHFSVGISYHCTDFFQHTVDNTTAPTPPLFRCVDTCQVVSKHIFHLCGGTAIGTLYHF